MHVSAVIPTYNYSQYIVEAVESALSQRNVAMDVIVVDDGSTDDTKARLAPYFDRITYEYQTNQGLSAARNRGIELAKGEWIALLDSDDYWHPDKTYTQLNAALRFDPNIQCIGSPSVSPLPPDLNPHPKVRKLEIPNLLLKAKFGPSSALIRRQSIESIGGFDVECGPAADRDMWLRLAAKYPIAFVDSPCWFYRYHSGQMISRVDKMDEDYRRVLRKFFAVHPEWANWKGQAEAYQLMDSAIAYREIGKPSIALKLAIQSLIRYPKAFAEKSIAFWRIRFLMSTLMKRIA